MNVEEGPGALLASCRGCGEPLSPGARVCAACGASVLTGGGNALAGIGLGFVAGCVVSVVAIFIDLEVSGHGHPLVTVVVEGTFVALGVAFVAGIASFAAGRPRLAFVLMTAAVVAALPATAFGFFTLACLQT